MRRCSRRPEDCRKRLFVSEAVARSSHMKAQYRLRIYPALGRCGRHGFHVANADKHDYAQDRQPARPRSSRTLALAPKRTLEECQAIADRMRGRA